MFQKLPNRLLIGIAMFFLAGGAEAREVQEIINPAEFDLLKPQRMDPNLIYFQHNCPDVVKFKDWNPVEKQFLSLYPGFQEPMLNVLENGVKKIKTEKIQVFVAKAKFLVKKPASSINLKGLISLDTIQRFAPEVFNQPLDPATAMPYVAGKKATNNFQWCNQGQFKPGTILRPATVQNLAYNAPKDRNWCNDAERSICVESCYPYNANWRKKVKTYNSLFSITRDFKKADYGSAMQSEIRYLTSESEINPTGSVRALTKINKPVVGALEQNIFYFNQIIEYGKVLAVFQEQDDYTTVVSAYMVMGILDRSWQKTGLSSVICGDLFNSDSGITAGLPIFTRDVLNAIAGVL